MERAFLISLILILFFATAPSSNAAVSDGYIHAAHYYAVSFDGEGDAVVRVRIEIENTTTEPIEEIELEIPGRILVYKAVEEYPGYELIDYDKELTSAATLLKLHLPYSIYQQQTATIVLFYKSPRQAENLFGIWNFDFKTIIDKDAVLIEYVRVAVNVQEGYHLKGGKAKVDYKEDFFSVGAMETMAAEEIDSYRYAQASDSIIYSRGLVKTTSNLDPWESFHVKGQYSENWFLLYGAEIVLGLIFAIIGFALIKIFVLNKIKVSGFNKYFKGNAFARIVGVGFLSALAIIIYWITVFFGLAFLEKVIYYGFAPLILLLLFLLGFVVIIGFLIGPAIYVASKHGAIEGFFTAVSSFAWLIILTIAALILFSILFPPVIIY